MPAEETHTLPYTAVKINPHARRQLQCYTLSRVALLGRKPCAHFDEAVVVSLFFFSFFFNSPALCGDGGSRSPIMERVVGGCRTASVT